MLLNNALFLEETDKELETAHLVDALNRTEPFNQGKDVLGKLIQSGMGSSRFDESKDSLFFLLEVSGRQVRF